MKQNLLSDALNACRTSFISVGVFSAVANMLMLVPAFFMLNVYDKAVAYNSMSTLWVLSLITAFLFLVLATMEILRSRILVLVASRLERALGPSLYRIVFDSAVKTPGTPTTQPLIDLNSLRQFLTGGAVFAVFDAPWLPIYLIILFLFHPLLGWLGVIAASTLFCLALLNQRHVSPPLAAANEAAQRNNVDTQLNLRNADVVAAMGIVSELQNRWLKGQEALLNKQEIASNYAGTYTAIIKTLRMAVQSAAIAAGAFLVLKQEISPGMLIAGSILVGRALQPVEAAVGSWKGFVEARAQYGRLDKLLSSSSAPVSRVSLPPIKGEIEVNSMTIIPPGTRKPVLQGITATIPSGSVCMILGPSGSGKSTFLRAVLGLWPCAGGTIRVDGAAPDKITRSEFGPQIGYLPQDIELLDGTVAQNIARFEAELDSAAVVTAAQAAGVHEFILSLPNGYETIVGRGTLSQGQQQRVALARALYKKPKLIILDEPNSNLDETGERALNQAIQSMKDHGSTVLMVSHRKTALPLADYLLVISNGRMKEFGPAKEILDRALAAGKRQNKAGSTVTVPVLSRTTDK